MPPQDSYVKPHETVHMRLKWAECIDNELRVRKLNEYGDPQGTTYSPDLSKMVAAYRAIEDRPDVGPLDDDMRRSLARYAWVLHRHPEMAATCSPTDAQDTTAQGATTELTDDEVNNFLRAEREEDEKHAFAVLRVRLVGPSTVKRGEPVKLAYEIVSTSDAPAMIGTGALVFIIERRGADGRWVEVWAWGNGLHYLPLIVRPVTASAPYHSEVTWNQADSNGVKVMPGEYRLSSPSSTHPNLPPPAAATFRIVD